MAGQQLRWNQSIKTSSTTAMPYLPKRNLFTQPKGSNGAAQGTARTKYPYQKDHRRSQEISPPSQASSGQMNIDITEQLTQNCPPCHQVTDGGGGWVTVLSHGHFPTESGAIHLWGSGKTSEQALSDPKTVTKSRQLDSLCCFFC